MGSEKGKAALFEDCGLGKTAQQLAWADCVSRHTKKPVLILTPLSVSRQTQREAEKFGIHAVIAHGQCDVKTIGIYITNYEKLDHFDPRVFSDVVLDESSILKSFTGIGSEGYCALNLGRRFVGSELKESYFKTACSNLRNAKQQMSLF